MYPVILVDAHAMVGEPAAGPVPAGIEGESAQCAHEGDYVARRHGGIEAALLGLIADEPGRLERPLMAEQRPMTPVRVDDAEQHAQGGRLARAVGAEDPVDGAFGDSEARSEEHTSELQSLMRISYAVFSLKKKKQHLT